MKQFILISIAILSSASAIASADVAELESKVAIKVEKYDLTPALERCLQLQEAIRIVTQDSSDVIIPPN